MRVNIDEIKEDGLERAWDVTREGVDEMVSGNSAGYRARAPAHVEAHLEKLNRRVMVEVRSRAELTAPCGRCLAPVSVAVPLDCALTFVPRDEQTPRATTPEGERARAHPRGSFDEARADEETYSGKSIDLDPVVREQLLLELPGYPVCREDCRGLCPACGANLNEHECGCDRRVPDPRWAGLEKLKPKP